MEKSKLKVSIVDDEQPARMVLRFHLKDEFEIHEFGSGEACINTILASGEVPDIFLVDIEMSGMDGIELCASLRSLGHENAQVIFVSAHDDLETRLKAYAAGGNDYLVKPYAVEELKAKLQIARQSLAMVIELNRQRELAVQAVGAREMAFVAMSSMGEMGVALEFLRSSFACRQPVELAETLFASLRSLELTGLLELRGIGEARFFSMEGQCTPLEISILGHARSSGRLFQFRDRVSINFPHITLVGKLPIFDPDRAGRLRDHLMVVAEGAEMRMVAMAQEHARLDQAGKVTQAVAELTQILADIEHHQQLHRIGILANFHDHQLEVERAFCKLALPEDHENALIAMVRGMADRLSQINESSSIEGARLRDVVARLQAVAGDAAEK